MKTLMTATALTVAFAGAATTVAADGHADPKATTCTEFLALDIADQEIALVDITSELEMDDNRDVKISDIAVLCNGMEEMAVYDILNEET